MNYEEAKAELQRNHLYPASIIQPDGSEQVVGLKIKTSPNYKDDRLLLMKGMLPKEFKLKWNKKDEAIIIEKE